MKKKKTALVVAMLFVMVLFTGCGESKEAAEINAYLAENYPASEEKSCPTPEELVKTLEDAGYTVERQENVGGLEIVTERIKAVKNEEYLDICYGVTEEQSVQDIMEYYIGQYDRCSIMTKEGAVFCYSSEAVAQQAGLFAE